MHHDLRQAPSKVSDHEMMMVDGRMLPLLLCCVTSVSNNRSLANNFNLLVRF